MQSWFKLEPCYLLWNILYAKGMGELHTQSRLRSRHKCSSGLEVQEYQQKNTYLSSSAAMRVTAAATLHET